MSQFGEKSATAASKADKNTNKKKEIKIRCILFFDGTLNNRDNIQGRLDYEKKNKTKASEAYTQYRINQEKEADLKKGKLSVELKEDSYENDFSNVVRLQQGIEEIQPGYEETVIIYMEGAGTFGEDPKEAKEIAERKLASKKKGGTEKIADAPKFGKDEKAGFAFAGGETGIKTKVERGIFKAIEQIVHGPGMKAREDIANIVVTQLTIDVFGFSRGAAAARYCVYQALKDVAVPDGVEMITSIPTLEGGEYACQSYHVESNLQRQLQQQWLVTKKVEACFVGLFDTVSSYWSAQLIKLLPLENWFVKLKAIKKAQKVVQLASADEHRYHFSLHNINSTGSKGEQYFLPGTHSDIGGGYLDKGSEAGLKVFEGSPADAIQDRKDYLIAQGWYQENQLVEKVLLAAPVVPSGAGLLTGMYSQDELDAYEPVPTKINLVVSPQNPRIVRNAYCQIPLKIMAEKAEKSGIKFLPKLKNKATGTLEPFNELKELESRIRAHMAKYGSHGSKPEHWHKTEYELDTQLKAIRNKHFHFSARYNTFFGHNPRHPFFSNKRKRYEFDG